MRSPLSATTVIACPHCGTRYQVSADTLGPKGREVQCAHCSKSWLAVAGAIDPPRPPAAAAPRDPDQLFDERAERELDADFVAEEKAVRAEAAFAAEAGAGPEPAAGAEAVAPPAPPAPKADPKLRRKRAKAFAQRQLSIAARLPMARVRRTMRLVTLTLLFALIGGGIALRTEVVRQWPDLAGAYAALGMAVNTVGLEFRDVHTLLALRSGASTIKVEARIYSVAQRTVPVPPVVVTLLDDAGTALYEWSVTPDARELERGEIVDFSSQLGSPPAGATRVRLTFSGGRAQSETQIAPAIQQPAL